MSFPNNPQDQDLVTIQGQEYRYVEAKDAWQKVLSNVPDLFDASTINGVSDLQFLRSDVADTMQGNLTLTGTLTATANTATIRTITVPETGSITVNGATAVTVIDDQGIVTDAAEIQSLTVNGGLTVQSTLTLSGGDLIHSGGLISTPEILLDPGGSLVLPADDSSTIGALQNFVIGQAQYSEPGNLSTFNTADALVNTGSSVDVSLVAAATIATGTGSGFTSELSAAYVFEDWESGTFAAGKWSSPTGANIRTNGTGTGTGGFAQSTAGSTRHLEFDTGTSRALVSTSLDLTNGNGVYPDAIYGIRYSAIIGNNSNGGAITTLGFSEGLNFLISSNGGSSYTTAVSNGGSTSWATTTVNFTSTQATETTVLQWTQNNADGTGTDEIALDNIEFLYRPTQEYYIQIGSKSVSRASALRLNSLPLFSVNSVTFRAIRGDGTNGEASPNSTNSIALWYSINGGAFTSFNNTTLTGSWADYTVDVSSLGRSVTSDDTSTIVFEFRNTNTLNRVFGVKSIAVNYDNPAFLRIRAPNRAMISSSRIELESNTINIGNSTSTGRVVLYSTGSSSSVNANNALFVSGGIYAGGIIRSAGGFFGNLSGTASSASFASSASAASSAQSINNNNYQETSFILTIDGTSYPSDSIYQYTLPQGGGQTNYQMYEITVSAYYYTPTSAPTLTSRFYKKFHFGFHTFPATYVIEGTANVYSFNSDATNFPAGAATAGKAFPSVVGNVVYLNLVQRTGAVADSITKFVVRISYWFA